MSIVTDIKVGAEVLLEANKIPQYQKLLEVMDQVTGLQDELQQTREELRKAKSEIQSIHDDAQVINTLTRVRDLLRDTDKHSYCVHCAIVDKRLGPLVRNHKGFTQCTRCKQEIHQAIP